VAGVEEISLQSMIEEVDLIVKGRLDWLSRARSGTIRRQPEVIRRFVSRLEVAEAIGELLRATKRAKDEAAPIKARPW
jgi:hypothetical protein